MADGAASVHGRLYGWLTDMGYSVTSRNANDASLDIGATKAGDFPINIRRDERDSLIVFTQTETDPETTRRLGAISADEVDTLVHTLRLELLRIGAEYSGLEVPLRTWVVLAKIYDEALTKQALFERLQLVRRGTYIVNMMVGRRITSPPTS